MLNTSFDDINCLIDCYITTNKREKYFNGIFEKLNKNNSDNKNDEMLKITIQQNNMAYDRLDLQNQMLKDEILQLKETIQENQSQHQQLLNFTNQLKFENDQQDVQIAEHQNKYNKMCEISRFAAQTIDQKNKIIEMLFAENLQMSNDHITSNTYNNIILGKLIEQKYISSQNQDNIFMYSQKSYLKKQELFDNEIIKLKQFIDYLEKNNNQDIKIHITETYWEKLNQFNCTITRFKDLISKCYRENYLSLQDIKLFTKFLNEKNIQLEFFQRTDLEIQLTPQALHQIQSELNTQEELIVFQRLMRYLWNKGQDFFQYCQKYDFSKKSIKNINDILNEFNLKNKKYQKERKQKKIDIRDIEENDENKENEKCLQQNILEDKFRIQVKKVKSSNSKDFLLRIS